MNLRKLLMLLAVTVAGCGVNTGVTPEPVDINGKVTTGGKPVSGIVLNLQVTGDGTPATIPVTDGAFQAKVTPGKYTYFVTRGSASSADLESIPEKYATGSLERQIEIAAGTALDIKLD